MRIRVYGSGLGWGSLSSYPRALLARLSVARDGARDPRRSNLSGGLSMIGDTLPESFSDILNGGSEGFESIQKDQRCATIQDGTNWKDNLLFNEWKD